MNLINKINKLEKDIKELKEKVKCIKNKDKSTTIDDIKVGEQFIYKGHNYTKLSDHNYCIIDDYDAGFMECIFDPISNDYDESVIRHYINSERFIERLGVDKNDLRSCYDEDYITLISMTQFAIYHNSIGKWGRWWMTCSSSSTSDHSICGFNVYGGADDGDISYMRGVRICLNLKPDTSVTRK